MTTDATLLDVTCCVHVHTLFHVVACCFCNIVGPRCSCRVRLHVNIGENLTAQLNVERQQVLHTFEVPPHVHPFFLQGTFSQATFVSNFVSFRREYISWPSDECRYESSINNVQKPHQNVMIEWEIILQDKLNIEKYSKHKQIVSCKD